MGERLGPAWGTVGRELGEGLPETFRRSNWQDLVIEQIDVERRWDQEMLSKAGRGGSCL